MLKLETNHRTLYKLKKRIHHFSLFCAPCFICIFVDKIFLKEITIITVAWETHLISWIYVSPKAIWECALDQGWESKVIDLGLPFFILVILVNSVYLYWGFFSLVYVGNTTGLSIFPSQDYCTQSNEFIYLKNAKFFVHGKDDYYFWKEEILESIGIFYY